MAIDCPNDPQPGHATPSEQPTTSTAAPPHPPAELSHRCAQAKADTHRQRRGHEKGQGSGLEDRHALSRLVRVEVYGYKLRVRSW